MNDLKQTFTHPREAIMWSITYCYNALDQNLPRVLLIGDSICNGYQEGVRDQLAGSACVSFWATSKCVTDRTFLEEMTFVASEYPYSLIHFNNGLHSLSTPIDEWEKSLRLAFSLLQEKNPQAKIIWCSSTPLREPALTQKVSQLNRVGEKIALENAFPINDLFSLMDPLDRHQEWTDTYHFRPEAREWQSKQVASLILRTIGGESVTREEARAFLKKSDSKTGPAGSIHF